MYKLNVNVLISWRLKKVKIIKRTLEYSIIEDVYYETQ